jgi:uncharacterized protein (DUF433 family)
LGAGTLEQKFFQFKKRRLEPADSSNQRSDVGCWHILPKLNESCAIFTPTATGKVMSEIHRITVDPEKCGGRPIIRCLRIRVKDVLDLLAAGASRQEILLDDYPMLQTEDITAVLEYAALQNDHPVLHVA